MITKFENFLYEFKNNDTPILNDIIDKLSKDGMDSLSNLEKEYLNNYSDINKREEIEGRMFGNNEPENSVDEIENSHDDENYYSGIWNNLRDEDIEDFIYSYNLPHDVANQSWDRLHISIRNKFKKFVDEIDLTS